MYTKIKHNIDLNEGWTILKDADVKLLDLIEDLGFNSGYKCFIQWDGNNMSPTYKGKVIERNWIIHKSTHYIDSYFFSDEDIELYKRYLKIKKIKDKL
jgi:hypothetical protein